MNIFERLFGAPSAPPQSIGEMVGGAAADPSQLMDQLANRERTQQVTNYMLYDSPFAEIVQAPLRGLQTFDNVAMGRTPTHVMQEDGQMVPNPEMVAGMADLAGSVTVGAGVMPDPSDLRMGVKAYHGTKRNIDNLSADDAGRGYLWFSNDKGYASGMAGRTNASKANAGSVFEVDLDIKSPLEIDVEKEAADLADYLGIDPSDASELEKAWLGGLNYESAVEKYMPQVEAGGHDAIVFRNTIDGFNYPTDQYAVFDGNLVNILKKFGIGGLLAGGAGGLAVGSQLSVEDRNRS